ncbi:hypothetical protein Pyn_01020 [Prunus yedoensis var. nudiflora]|uniref:Uncharacterized protein n=1 Tax=Prunus yedoensis var. nudiflora TaxID=2094558 RepID=A0A314UIF7_PRUYE|nr:hypothetical protein Pyn_01020 [Prunus yedoensis var. nudiflora]
MIALLEYLGFSTIFVCALRASPAQQHNRQKAPLASPRQLQRCSLQPGLAWVPLARASPRAGFAWASARGL